MIGEFRTKFNTVRYMNTYYKDEILVHPQYQKVSLRLYDLLKRDQKYTFEQVDTILKEEAEKSNKGVKHGW